jgi:hypothetical protein
MAKEKGVQISATVSKELHQNLEDHRWTVRLTMTELTRRAVEEYAQRHGLLPAGEDATGQDAGDGEQDAANG